MLQETKQNKMFASLKHGKFKVPFELKKKKEKDKTFNFTFNFQFGIQLSLAVHDIIT